MLVHPHQPTPRILLPAPDPDARTAEAAAVLGKCDDVLAIKMPGDMKDDISALARINGKDASRYVREVLETHLYGRVQLANRMVREN